MSAFRHYRRNKRQIPCERISFELKAHSHGYAGFFISLFVYLFHFRYSGGLCLYLVPQNNNHLDNNNNNSHLAETSPYWIV